MLLTSNWEMKSCWELLMLFEGLFSEHSSGTAPAGSAAQMGWALLAAHGHLCWERRCDLCSVGRDDPSPSLVPRGPCTSPATLSMIV